LNKPKDYITTTDDPQGRKNGIAVDTKSNHGKSYPIGRLDREYFRRFIANQ